MGAPIDFPKALENLYSSFKLNVAERAPLKSATNSDQARDTLEKLEQRSEKQEALLKSLKQSGALTHQIRSLLLKALPKFMYFSSYDRMDGAIQIENVRELIGNGQIKLDDNRGKRLFVEFLDYAGVPIDEIVSVTTYETFNALLKSASIDITDQVLEYWSQNPDLEVDVRIEQSRSGDPVPFNKGTIARARINNKLHRADTPFSERSAGFVWFFSFLVKFAQVKHEQTPVVLLLDEPGLTLHGKAQADLLRFFDEKLAPHHQIVYSTHSPFMVAPDRLLSARIVEDQVETKGPRRISNGTHVREDVLERDPDTLFPLQGALGYEVSQSLFVGKNTVLVEGPSDILYLQSLSDALIRRKRPGLNPRWTLCPSGGIDKIRPFVSLFGGNGINVAVLSDYAAGDRRKAEEFRKGEILKAGHFFTVVDFVDQPEGDIEDLLEADLFVEVLNRAYDLPEPRRLTPASLAAAAPDTPRKVKQAAAAFRVMPAEIPEFDHFTPAAWLIRHLEILDGDTPAVSATLDRAANVFATFNGLLH